MITVDQRQFGRAVKFASSVVGKRSTIPVLTTVKASANGALHLDGTDLDTYARASLPYDGDEAEFLIQSPSQVAAAVKKAGAETVSFDRRDKELRVEAGELVADLSHTMHADDFPTMELIAEETFGALVDASLFRLLERVRPAISTEETRYYLNGIYVHAIGDGAYRFVATDGHRLFVADAALPGASGEIAEGVIIPRRAIEKVIGQFAKAESARFVLGRTVKSNQPDKTLAPSAHPSRAGFTAEIDGVRFELATKLIDGTFPDYTRVVPAEHKFAMRMARADLLKAIKTITPLSSDKTRALRLTALRDGLTLELQSPDFGKSRFPVAAEHDAPADFYIGLNAAYLLDAANAFTGETIEFGLDDPGAPVTITDPDDGGFKVVQMPIRV
jgi:DNA polymerase-3 subunit beta